MKIIIDGAEYTAKMKVEINGRVYFANSAVALIDEIKGLNWSATPDTDAEGYIAIQADTMSKLWEKELILPDGDTEARAVAMFEAIAAMGGWYFEKED